MKRNLGNIGIFLIVILGVILRLLFINKPDGLWNDEYLSWTIANTPLMHGFIEGIKSQCHMPFYYLYLKFFMTLFGQSDLLLRLTSVLAGGLSIIAMYFVGLEKDKKTGFACAAFTALSSFLIYYSQEVRFYSVLFLFSALTILYSIRTIKEPCKKNFILSAIFNFLILFTHTIGFVFVFFNLIFISINLFKHYKKVIIIIWSSVIVGAIALSSFSLKTLFSQSFSQWWGHFSVSKIGFLLTDYFSPVLTNLTNSPDNFFYNFNVKFILFAIIPTVIALFFLAKSLRNKLNLQLFSIAILTLFVMVLAAMSGKLVLLTKYSIEIYPILILLVCSGFSEIRSNTFKYFLASIYCILCIFYIIQSPLSAPKIRHSEGHKIMTDILKRTELKKNDIILLEYYPQSRFEKYFDFSSYKVVTVNKGNFAGYLTDDTTYNQAYHNGKELYKDMFSSDSKNKFLENKLNDEILKDMKNGQSLAVVVLESVAFHSPTELNKIMSDANAYQREPLLFMAFSYLKYQIYEDMLKSLSMTRYEQKGSWTVVKFTKLHN